MNVTCWRLMNADVGKWSLNLIFWLGCKAWIMKRKSDKIIFLYRFSDNLTKFFYSFFNCSEVTKLLHDQNCLNTLRTMKENQNCSSKVTLNVGLKIICRWFLFNLWVYLNNPLLSDCSLASVVTYLVTEVVCVTWHLCIAAISTYFSFAV